MTDTPAHTPLPLSCTHNSWERSTIYDANGDEICAIEISWEADEDTQDHFEKLKDAKAAFIVRACNSHYQLKEALRRIADETRRKQLPLTTLINEIATAALSQAGGASD